MSLVAKSMYLHKFNTPSYEQYTSSNKIPVKHEITGNAGEETQDERLMKRAS